MQIHKDVLRIGPVQYLRARKVNGQAPFSASAISAFAISEEAPDRNTKKDEGDAGHQIFLKAVAKITVGNEHLGRCRSDGGGKRNNQERAKKSLVQFVTSDGFEPLD